MKKLLIPLLFLAAFCQAQQGYSPIATKQWNKDTVLNTKAQKINSQGGLIVGGYNLNADAVLEVSSTTKTFLPPRMTAVQRLAISPTNGAIVYDSDSNKVCYYNGSWICLSNTGGGGGVGPTGPTGATGATGPTGADVSGGTVTTISVTTANGLAGSVANPTTTPAITLRTTVSGILKGNGTAISAAVAGTDYATPKSAANGLWNDGDSIGLGRTPLVENTTVECDGNTLQLIETDPAIGTAEIIIINTSPLLRGGFLVRNNNDAGFYAGNTASSGLDALRAQTEVVDGSGVSTGWYAQMLAGVYTTGLRMDNTIGGTTMNFENDNNETFFSYDCDNTITTLGTAGDRTDLLGNIRATALAGSGTGIVAVDNDGDLSFSAGNGSWKNTGNTGLTDGVDNLLGTTDAIPVRFIVNNQEAGYIDATGVSGNTIFGYLSAPNLSFDNTTVFGNSSLTDAEDGIGNTVVGNNAGNAIVDGNANVVLGSGADMTGDYSDVIVLGASASATAANQFAIGPQTHLKFASVTNIKTAALVSFDDDTDAGLGGLTTGEWYQTTGSGAAPLNVAGIVMIKQ